MPFRTRAVLFLMAACAASLAAQTPVQKKPTPPNTTFVRHVNEVNIVFAATNKHGKYLTGIKPAYLKVYDNNKLQKIKQLFTENDVPLRLALVLDTSTSVQVRFHFEQQAAISFLETIVRKGLDKAMVVAFDTRVTVEQPMTDNVHQLAHAIRGLSANGGTALYDAVYYTIRNELLKSGGPHVRRVMVIISDGADDASTVSLDRALRLAESTGVVIFAISTDPTGIDAHNDEVMNSFAAATGGLFFFPFRANALGRMFTKISYELRHEYVLTYEPNNFVPNGAFHRVRIEPKFGGIRIRARRGYFASLIRN